jgi:hypothetical protein
MSETITSLTVKRSFEQRAKRLGIATELESAIDKDQLQVFKDCKFWIWDQKRHALEFKRTNGKCCFNHIVGLPTKNNETHPIHPFQKEIMDALMQYKLIAILKSRNVGASEILLRYAFWLCVKDDRMRGMNMSVITGIREDLSLELLRRYKNLMPSLKWNTKENVAEVNGCRLIGYPSKRVKDLRGLTDTKLVICDEFCWFDPNDQQQVLPVLEVFRAKSDAQVMLISTPAALNDVMYNLYQEPESKCRYKRLYIPWQKAYGTMFTEQEIAQAKKQPNFEQEFNLKFGSYGAGTIFNLSDINRTLRLGEQYVKEDPSYPRIGDERADIHAIGVDVGFGHSKFSISMVSIMDEKIHVVYCKEWQNPDEDWVIQKILDLRRQTGNPKQTKVYVDASAVPFIKRLKGALGERTDYQNFTEELKKRKLIRSEDQREIIYYMRAIPIPFSPKNRVSMISNLYTFLSRGDLVIHPSKFPVLVSALQSARNVPNNRFALDKSTQSMDALDSVQLACFNFDAEAKTEFFESEDEEDEELEEEEMAA